MTQLAPPDLRWAVVIKFISNSLQCMLNGAVFTIKEPAGFGLAPINPAKSLPR
jgi:hypothetical protein